MRLVITLSKAVNDTEQGQELFDIVKERLADKPDIKIQGNISEAIEPTPT